MGIRLSFGVDEMKVRQWMRQLLHSFLFILFLVGSFSLSFYLIGLLHFQLSDYVRYIISIVAGISLMIVFGAIIHLFTRKRHQHMYVEIIAALHKIANGDFNVYLDFNLDQRNGFKELADHFNHMVRQLQQMEDMRQEFISNVSHEIQSPLTSIVGFTQALQHNHLSVEERNHYLSIIETESRRLSKLSDNLLKLTSLESDHQPFEKNQYRLDQQMRSIILSSEPNWSQKDLELEISLDKVTVWADEDLMSQVWVNLIHNSIKFTPAKGKLKIQLNQMGDKAIVTISDTGIGISEKDQLHIFERFYKADQARERSKSGSGLGLSIVKKIMDMHNGHITVHSEVQVGTAFSVILPIA